MGLIDFPIHIILHGACFSFVRYRTDLAPLTLYSFVHAEKNGSVMMLNLQVVSSSGDTRRKPSSNPVALKLATTEHLSDFSELLSLMRFDDPLRRLSEAGLFRRRRLRAGQSAQSMGAAFDGLYVVRLGALKASITDIDGAEHVLAFPMKGDMLGSDGICHGKYMSDITALTDCDLIRIPAEALFSKERACHDLEHLVCWAISRQIIQEQSANAMTNLPKVNARLAHFLGIQGERFASMGFSAAEFILPMTRRDIASYLNVSMESVSRAFTALRQMGAIGVERRSIKILARQTLFDYGR